MNLPGAYVVVACVVSALAFGCSGARAAQGNGSSPPPVAAKRAPGNTQVERGQYLVLVGDCVSCHTAEGGKPYAGGRPLDTGFGAIYAPNITPDRETGIGNWSTDDFYRAMHRGHDDEGQPLYPAFPYPWFTRVTRADVDAIKAFLDSVAPVHQQ
ncbi:MAG: cytochrome c, partial [Casimicrobiaceae bacterium]